MRELKISAVVGISVTVLAVVTAFAFSFSSISYQKEVAKLKKMNEEYKITIHEYKTDLDGIKKMLSEIRVRG